MTEYLSHTEISTENLCSRQHFYQFILKLVPPEKSEPLQYGIYGHKMIEEYYSVILQGGNDDDARMAAFKYLDSIGPEISDKVRSVLELHMMKYFLFYKHKPWRIIAVEKQIKVAFPDKPYGYACTVDLIVEILEGEYKGKIAVVDHKWTYNYWSIWSVLMNSQLPRYIWASREAGLSIDMGIISQVRYRTFKDYSKADLFKHEFLTPEPEEIENNLLEFHKSAEVIWERKKLAEVSLKEAKLDTKRVMHKLICDYCDYKRPCHAGLQGRSEATILTTQFVESDYGYNK